MTKDTHIPQAPRRASSTTIFGLLACGVALLAIGAFTLSFDALRSLAELAGIRRSLTFLWPLVVDGFIVVATISAVLMRSRGWRVAWYPWATLILFGTISVIGNALHAHAHASSMIGVSVAAMVSAVPAIALLLASHLFVLVLTPTVHTTAAITAGQIPNPPSSPTGKKTPGTQEPAEADQGASNQAQTPVPSSLAAVAVSQRSTKTTSARTASDEIDSWISAQLALGTTITGSDVATRFGVSAATGRRRLAAARASTPTLSVVRDASAAR